MRRIVSGIILFCAVSLSMVRQQSDASTWLYNTVTPSAQLVISANGNVGIGTTAPSTKSVTTNTATATLAVSDKVIFSDATSGEITLTLPSAGNASGRTVYVVKTDASSNRVILYGNGSTIEGYSTYELWAYNDGVTLISNGANW